MPLMILLSLQWSQAYPADPMEYKLRVAFETGSSSSLVSEGGEQDPLGTDVYFLICK